MLDGVPEPVELGTFLRAHRERLRPAEVGLPDTGRRRTPGLRREEVAALAGLSIDYLVRLEQGRDRHPSPSVIHALADALRLNDDERLHLVKLANCDTCPSATATDEVAPTVQRLLDQLAPTPAFVLGPWYQVIAANEAWERLVAPLGMLDGDPPNLARFTFLDPRAPAAMPDWETAADLQVSSLRAASVRWRGDERLTDLLDELHGVPAFDRRWAAHQVLNKRRGTKELVHPGEGLLRIAYEVLLLPDDEGHRFITWLPADDATAAAFSRIAGVSTPATLRVVAG